MRQPLSLPRPRRRKETLPNPPGHPNLSFYTSSEEFCCLTLPDPPPMFCLSQSHASSPAIAIPCSGVRSGGTTRSSYQSSVGRLDLEGNVLYRKQSRENTESEDNAPNGRTIIGSDPSSESTNNKQGLNRRLKALVNPFNPAQITIKLTSNRRRWTHVFPLGTNDHRQSSLGRKELHSSFGNLSCTAGDVRSPNSGGRCSTSLQPLESSLPAWGTSEEQDWTPAITTGVDWKSMVIPACLPITTDYFPDRLSLQYDYVISDYNLLPEDISTENAVPRYFQNDEDVVRHALTTPEVFKELISQRLQQGFQIILLSKQHSSYPSAQVSSTSPQFSYAMLKGPQSTEQTDEYLLSIGRIFHRLNLDGPRITVTQYRPRHPHREIKVHYCYRFHAPDSDTYGVSWVDFTSERLENYNWNYLDHYICNRGEGEFELKESLKYWRLRMLLLPAGQPETRKIIDGNNQCDLYNTFSEEEKTQQKEGILKFLEVMNKVKRVNTRKPKFLPLPPRRSSLGQSSLATSNVLSSLRDRVGSNRVHDRPRMRSNSARMGARPEQTAVPSGRISPVTEADGRITMPKVDPAPSNNETLEDIFPVEMKKLSESATDQEIIQAMKHTQDGLNFLSKVGWSSFTFISSEAVNWMMEHVEGVLVEQQAIKILQGFVDKDIICHVSRAKSHSFKHGFYLYYIGSSNDQEMNKAWDKSELPEYEAVYLFEREWMEVELSPSSEQQDIENYSFPSDEDIWCTPYLSKSKLKLKSCNIQIDAKSGRQEWGQLRYQNVYRPYETFEVVVEWMVATGNKAAELVQSWARKSTQYGFQLVPIPSDPFALPFSNDSDPLRGPIFIPLDLSCLVETSVQSLDEKGLLKLQEKILCKFGFIPYRNPNSSAPPQYVHISGSMFIMLPVRPHETKKTSSIHLASLDLTQISSPHEEYITRHFSGGRTKRLSTLNAETDPKIGFLWSWNYMITKRWKNSGTVDESFMRKVMRDFRAFCLNQESRLEDFWKFSDVADFGADQSLLMDLES